MGITRRYKDTTLEHELTKPCPLMPDGEWVKIPLEYGFYKTGDDTLQIYIYGEWDDRFISIAPNVRSGEVYKVASTSNASFNIQVDGVEHIFGECRMSFQMNNDILPLTNNLHQVLQGLYSWSILSNGKQAYFILSSLNVLTNLVNSEFTTAMERGSYLKVADIVVYCYVINA